MTFYADLHVHSRYSRATSRDMCPEGLWRGAQLKGISVIGTGDFTHPVYLEELRQKLEPQGNGLFTLRNSFRADDVPGSCRADVAFLLSSEISCIYRKAGRTRKVHAVVLMPDLSSVERLNLSLARIGNLRSDGRPILGLDAKELLRLCLDASPDGLFIPAHAWTPHFSVFGAASGFDSLEECFEELTREVYAIETGLSSDPAMNWRLSKLDGITLVSNSDAHSIAKLGREASLFDAPLSYDAIRKAIVSRKGFAGTIEFFPEEGKYHLDGHRNCGVRLFPAETERLGGTCPACGRRVTVGVLSRVTKLADRDEGFRPNGAPGYASIIPLAELIGGALDVGPGSKKAERIYSALLRELGSEFFLLREAGLSDIARVSNEGVAAAVEHMRNGRVLIEPGYDGAYGRVRISVDGKGKQASIK